MKKVVIFGAAGHTGKYLTRKIQKAADIELTAFVRDPAKFGDMDMTGVNIIWGDALNADDVRRAMNGQDVILCSLEGDVLTMAKNIVSALDETGGKKDYLDHRHGNTSRDRGYSWHDAESACQTAPGVYRSG